MQSNLNKERKKKYVLQMKMESDREMGWRENERESNFWLAFKNERTHSENYF